MKDYKNGSLSLIGISNDLTFKERLDPRVISSLSEEEIVFPNYVTNEITGILKDRINMAFENDVVSSGALNLCASMACGEHGDARRAIDLLRVAAEIAERNQTKPITDEHVRMAAQKIEENKEVVALKSYPLHEKLLIINYNENHQTSQPGMFIPSTNHFVRKPTKTNLHRDE